MTLSSRTRGSITNPQSSPSDRGAEDEFRAHDLVLAADLAGLRLDQALARALPQYSRERLKAWIEAGSVEVDGRRLRPKDRILGGELVRIQARLPVQTPAEAEALPLSVVFQDRAIIVLDKPPGLVVHPGAGNRHHTLLNALLALDPALERVPRAGLVHRLDKDTSGLLVVARTPEVHAALVRALARREIGRAYLAVCLGVMTAGGTIEEPIGRHRTLRTRMAVRADGRAALTEYRVLERYRAHTLARVELGTGRTHQIRVHLAHIGFPIVGDPVYGGRIRLPAGCTPQLREQLAHFPRQALHAAQLRLEHPVSGRSLSWEAPLPPDMRALLDALEADRQAARQASRARR